MFSLYRSRNGDGEATLGHVVPGKGKREQKLSRELEKREIMTEMPVSQESEPFVYFPIEVHL